MLVVNSLCAPVKTIRLRGVRKVRATTQGLGLRANVGVEARPFGPAEATMQVRYFVVVHIGGNRKNGEGVYVRVDMGYLNPDFLTDAVADLGHPMQNPTDLFTSTPDEPLMYLSHAIGAAIAARSELVVSAEKRGDISVELVCRLPREVWKRQAFPQMWGNASQTDLAQFFRPARRTRRKKVRAA